MKQVYVLIFCLSSASACAMEHESNAHQYSKKEIKAVQDTCKIARVWYNAMLSQYRLHNKCDLRGVIHQDITFESRLWTDEGIALCLNKGVGHPVVAVCTPLGRMKLPISFCMPSEMQVFERNFCAPITRRSKICFCEGQEWWAVTEIDQEPMDYAPGLKHSVFSEEKLHALRSEVQQQVRRELEQDLEA